MKIFYFTGTGNSYDLASRLGGEIIDISKFDGTVVEDDAVGIVCPVYCADVPEPVWKFIDRVEIRSPYVFAAVTAGGSEGNALTSLKYRLKKRGVALRYGACVVMPDNVIVFPTEEEKRERELALVPELAERIKKAVAARKTVEIADKKSPSLFTKAEWFFMRYGFGIRKKKADPAVCTRCGLCADCPTGNIKIAETGAVFGDRCADCFRCIQICPVNAIAFGRVKRTEKTRYFNKNYWKAGAGR